MFIFEASFLELKTSLILLPMMPLAFRQRINRSGKYWKIDGSALRCWVSFSSSSDAQRNSSSFSASALLKD
eukprot:Skav230314  [mRNA]  locus=scaffold430:222610:223416:- [translate_table: standard]